MRLLSPRRSPCVTHLPDFWRFDLEHARWRELPSLATIAGGGGPMVRRERCPTATLGASHLAEKLLERETQRRPQAPHVYGA